MIIGFDVTWMDRENKNGGVFQYACRLISALVNHTGENVVAIIGPGGGGVFDGLKQRGNFKEVLKRNEAPLTGIVESEKIEVVHAPIQYFIDLTFSAPMIITLHDLQHMRYPEFFSRKEIEERNFLYRQSAEFSERVIVSYQHVKEDIREFYGVPEEKIDVCPIGLIPPAPTGGGEINAVRKKYGIPERYLFYSANTWPHKNHIGLIRAIKILHGKHGIKMPLVCTGQKTDHFPRVEEAVKSLGLKDMVFFPGYIPENEVFLLLKNAALAVIPTIYEAGSFPLMEAMSNGVPVICSDVTSLPDTIGDRRFVFDPKDEAGMADKISSMLKDEKLVRENIENSKKRIKEGGWDRAVRKFLETYAIAIDEFRRGQDVSHMKAKMRIYEQRTNTRISELLESKSWKLTAPLRSAADFLKKDRK